MDGHSLLPLMWGAVPDEGGEAFIQYDGNGSRSNFQRCLVQGQYKLIADIFKDEIFYELYDVERDPQETCNLLFDEAYDDMARVLSERLRAYMQDGGDIIQLPDLSPEVFRQMYAPFPANG